MHTLLRYDAPVMEDHDNKERLNPDKTFATFCPYSENMAPTPTCKSMVSCQISKDELISRTIEQFLPPMKYKEMGAKWEKHVSTKQCTPIEMKNLESEVDRLLQIRSSRKKPLCPIREEVLQDLIKETLRQVIIDCPEQGMLLKRILDHFQTEFTAYETLLRFTDAFIGRKRTAWLHWKANCLKKISELEESKRILEYQAAELKHKADQLEKRNQEYKVKRDAARLEEIKFHKKRGEHLKQLYEAPSGKVED